MSKRLSQRKDGSHDKSSFNRPLPIQIGAGSFSRAGRPQNLFNEGRDDASIGVRSSYLGLNSLSTIGKAKPLLV